MFEEYSFDKSLRLLNVFEQITDIRYRKFRTMTTKL